MARLRLFAAARQAAGTAQTAVPGSTVTEVLEAAVDRFGPELGRVIERSRIWINGEPAGAEDRVDEADEVAVLPPVSGGCGWAP